MHKYPVALFRKTITCNSSKPCFGFILLKSPAANSARVNYLLLQDYLEELL